MKFQKYFVAIAVKGHEYLYNPKTAHGVPNSTAEKMVEILNEYKFKIKDPETEVWHLFERNQFSESNIYACAQEFKFYRGVLREYDYKLHF